MCADVHHTPQLTPYPSNTGFSDVPILCDMDTTDRPESYECCCGLCSGGKEKVAESKQNNSTTEESCGKSG